MRCAAHDSMSRVRYRRLAVYLHPLTRCLWGRCISGSTYLPRPAMALLTPMSVRKTTHRKQELAQEIGVSVSLTTGITIMNASHEQNHHKSRIVQNQSVVDLLIGLQKPLWDRDIPWRAPGGVEVGRGPLEHNPTWVLLPKHIPQLQPACN